MEKSIPASYYRENINTLTTALSGYKKKHASLGWARLSVVVVLCFAVYKAWPNAGIIAVTVVVLIAIFLYLVSLALATEEKINNTNRLLAINRNALEYLNYQFSKQANDGAAYISEFQLPDNDLDLFGPASLFQYINRAHSHHGMLALAKSFIAATDSKTIAAKQQAVKELSEKPDWCQQLQSYAHIAPVTRQTETLIAEWLTDKSDDFNKPVWQILRWLVPLVSFATLALYLAGVIADGTFNTILLLMLGFVFSFYKKITKQYSQLSKVAPQLNAFLPTLQWIENANFSSTLLKEKQAGLLQNGKASKAISSLKAVLKKFDYRLNPVVYLPLSAFLFWDLQQVLSLEKWKKAQTSQLEKWFEIAGDFEMLASFATLRFDQPGWVFPEITDEWFVLDCKAVGHPLIPPGKVVTNDFSMQNNPQFALITGSNMAGKSTFLRTIGANMVLAMTGAPVHAAYLKLPVVRIISSMRITDNLEEATSTFYAELKKMKRIVDAANAGEKIFILLDEMLRGTNTTDRHTGSVALIKQLVKKGAVGIIASHDIALAQLELQYPQAISNYHFDSTIVNGEIVFDYRKKNGVCNSTNASLLMKKIGIEMDA